MFLYTKSKYKMIKIYNFFIFSGSRRVSTTNIGKNEGELQQSFSRRVLLQAFTISNFYDYRLITSLYELLMIKRFYQNLTSNLEI